MNLKFYSHTNIVDNLHILKGFFFLFSIFIVVAPYSGYIYLQSGLAQYFQSNFSNFTGIPKNINPIFLIFEAIGYQIELFFEFVLPRFWGTNNYFFLRFIFKLPLFIFYFLSAIILSKIIQLQFDNENLTGLVFYFQLFNLPLMYETFIIGNPESIPIFFILLSYYEILQIDNKQIPVNQTIGYLVIAGFFLGISISFSYFSLLLLVLIWNKLSIKNTLIYILGSIISLMFIYFPLLFFSTANQLPLNQDMFGIYNLITIFRLSNVSIVLQIIEAILILIIILNNKLTVFSKITIVGIFVLILTPNFFLTDYIIVFQFFLLGVVESFQLNINDPFTFDRKHISSRYTVLLSLSIISLSVLFVIYGFFIYPVTDVFYIGIIINGILGKFNVAFWRLNSVLEFKVLFYVIFSFLFVFMVFIIQKKRKAFNTDKNF